MDTAWRDCQCLCDADAIGDMKSFEVLDESGVLGWAQFFDQEMRVIDTWTANGTILNVLPGYSAEESAAIYDDLLGMLCSPGHIGDMFQATSSNDPTFWVLHGTLDRS